MKSLPDGGQPLPSPGQFATTQWSMVVRAGKRDDSEAEAALAELCQRYWLPLYAYVRRRVADVNEAASGLTAEQFYDQQWAIALLGQILERLQGEFDAGGKGQLFEELKGFIIGEHTGTTYGQVAVRLSMTEAAAKKAASRMRRRYRELLREEIARTVAVPDEVEEEIRNLFVTLKA